MSLHIVITGALVRSFLQLLNSLCKVDSDVPVFFLAREDALEVSVLSASRAVHLLARIPSQQFKSYQYTSVAPDRTEKDYFMQNTNNNNNNNNNTLFLSLPTKVLMGTVLHNTYSGTSSVINSIEIDYNPYRNAPKTAQDPFVRETGDSDHISSSNYTNQNETNNNAVGSDPDTVRWTFRFDHHCTKTYTLKLMNDLFQRVQTNDTDYFFEFAAESKFLGTLLGSLPPSAPRCVVAPMDSSLQVRCVDGYTSSTSAAARREGGTAAVITANPSHFFWFRYFQHQPITRADEDVVPNSADGVRTPSAVQPSGGDPPPSNATEEVTSAALPLPSKVVDVKPLRVVAHLAGQLGLHLLVRCGIHGTPIEVRSVTNQDAQQRQQQYNPPKDGTNSGRPSSLFSAPPHLNNYMDSVVPIQFSMHLAAEDLSTPEPMVEGRASASESVTVASGRASEKMLSSTPFSRHSNHPNISVPPTPLATDLTPASVREVPSSDQNNNNHQNQNTTVAGRTSMVSHVSTSQPADWSGRELPPPRSNHVSCTGDSRVPPTLSADSAVQGSSNNPQRLAAGQSLSAMFPLDFAAFAQADYNDVQRQLLEIPLEEEEDEEIRQFLDSCVSMSVAPSEEK